MKTNNIISKTDSTAAKIARQIVVAAAKTYVPEDVQKAVDAAIAKFYHEMLQAAQHEIKFLTMKKVPPKTGI